MKEWDYDELVEDVIECYNTSIEDDGFDEGQAAERSLYEFENVINDGYTEKAVIYTTLGLLLAETGSISRYHYDKIIAVLNPFDSKKESLDLQQEEKEKLVLQVEKLKTELSSIEIVQE